MHSSFLRHANLLLHFSALICACRFSTSLAAPYLPLSGDEIPHDCDLPSEVQGWFGLTVPLHQRIPSISLQSRSAPQRRQQAERIFSYDIALPDAVLRRAQGPLGDTTRLMRVFHKALAGQPISISFVGGSITEGGGVHYEIRPYHAFTSMVTEWFRLSFPNSTIRSQNAGIGGVTSTYYAQCVDMFVADEDVDLVIVDFTLNDMASGDKKRSPEFDTADRRGFELLLRKLLSFKQHPAVFVLHSWSPFFNSPNYYSTVEDLYQSLVAYYGLQSASVRNAMYHPTYQRQPSYRGTQWLCDPIHPNRLGHRYVAELIIGTLQQLALQAVLHPPNQYSQANLALPPPMFENNLESNSQCFRGDHLQEHMFETRGWLWVDEGHDGRHKFGYVTDEPDHSLTFQVNTAGCPDPTAEVALGIGHLRSYERMGQAQVSCTSGCTCVPMRFDGHMPEVKASQEFWAYMAVTQSEACVLEVSSLSDTGSGENKVKVTSLLVTCMKPEQALDLPEPPPDLGLGDTSIHQSLGRRYLMAQAGTVS